MSVLESRVAAREGRVAMRDGQWWIRIHWVEGELFQWMGPFADYDGALDQLREWLLEEVL